VSTLFVEPVFGVVPDDSARQMTGHQPLADDRAAAFGISPGSSLWHITGCQPKPAMQPWAIGSRLGSCPAALDAGRGAKPGEGLQVAEGSRAARLAPPPMRMHDQKYSGTMF
jgi:hypothetical protein